MAYYTGLARVAQSTGRPVVEEPGWETRGLGQMGPVKSIICHHTAGSTRGDYPSRGVVRDGRTGLRGPLAQFGLARDGTIYVVAAGLSAHAGRDSLVLAPRYRNRSAIGIEAENCGTGKEDWPQDQLESYVALCRALIDEFNLSPDDVRGHREIAVNRHGELGRKVDPVGFTMDEFRSAVERGHWADGEPGSTISVQGLVRDEDKAKAKAKAKDQVKEQVKVKDKRDPRAEKTSTVGDGRSLWPASQLPASDKHTKDSHNAWVRLLADVGFTGPSLGHALQRWLSQKGFYDGRVDGDFGLLSTKALQRFLKGKGHYKGRLDGDRGPMTVKAEIAYLNAQRRHYQEAG